jgi:hypothetical protein
MMFNFNLKLRCREVTLQKDGQLVTKPMPLLEYLSALNGNCGIDTLEMLLNNPTQREKILLQLKNIDLCTNHHKKTWQIYVKCDDLSVGPATRTRALKGYLGITVRQYYFIKHGVKLRYPHLPCVIEYGEGSHRSYFPLEVLSVYIN